MQRKLLTFVLFAVAVSATPKMHAQSHWPALMVGPAEPNPDSGDPLAPGPLRDACFNLDQWATGRDRTDWFGTADWAINLLSDGEQSACFSNLNAAGIGLGIGVPVLKSWCQTGQACFNAVQSYVQRMMANGLPQVGAFFLDEPLTAIYNGSVPGDFGYALQETQAFISLIRANHPGAKIIEQEAYPFIQELTLQSWINGLVSGDPSTRPDYFEVDHDWAAGGTLGDLNQLKATAHAAGLQFGYILWASNAPQSYNDADWYNGVMSQTASIPGLSADLYYLTSWIHTPRTTVPEAQPYTFMYTLRDIIWFRCILQGC